MKLLPLRWLLVLTSAWLQQAAPHASAATVTVTTAVDEFDFPGMPGTGLSLREALRDALAGDVIVFAPALSGRTNRLTNPFGTLTLIKNVTIDAAALAAGFTVSGDANGNSIADEGDVQVFRVESGYPQIDIGASELQNSPPTISLITDTTTPVITARTLEFKIGDYETPLASLVLSKNSSATEVVPNGNIVFSGDGANRMVTITGLNRGVSTITLTVSDGLASASQSFLVTVFNPLAVSIAPAPPLLVIPGSNVTFNALAIGDGPYTYQWRYNGADIPNQTNNDLALGNVQATDAGNYNVVVANPRQTVFSATTSLRVITPALGLANNFGDALTLTTNTFVGGGSNAGATQEPGEPDHFGKIGGKSVWINWQAPTSNVRRS